MKISIVGVGSVGSTLAYTLLIRNLVDELVLVGRDKRRLEGDVLDLQHAHMFSRSNTRVSAGGWADTAGSGVVVLCAAKPWKDGPRDRLAAAAENAALFKEIIPPIAEASPDAKLLVLTNPVDVLTYLTLRISRFPAARVMGTGTLIDSARFRRLLSERFAIHPEDLRCYVLGEHGDSQFPAFSVAGVGGEPIRDTPQHRALFEKARGSGADVLQSKGYTNYAIAMAAASVIDSMVNDSKKTMPLSVMVEDYLGIRDVCLSLPVVVGRVGVERVLRPDLNALETKQLVASAAVIRETLDRC